MNKPVKNYTEFLNEELSIYSDEGQRLLRDLNMHRQFMTVNNDGSIDYDGNIDLSGRDIKEIPFKFGTVNGNFNCSNTKIISLKNSPKYINGDADFSDNNNIISLENGPIEIEGNFDCSGSRYLYTLKSGPKTVGGDYKCFRTPLLSSKHDCKIGGKFLIDSNIRWNPYFLKTDDGFPLSVEQQNKILNDLKEWDPEAYSETIKILEEYESPRRHK